jgi:hypothetical protein
MDDPGLPATEFLGDPLFVFSKKLAMQIEYLEGDQPPLPLVRLFGFEPHEINELRQACRELAAGRLTEFAVHEQPWARPVRGCRFVWRASKKDIGVRSPGSGQPLVLEYSDEAWREVEDKLAHFVEPLPHTFNWLAIEGDIRVLISADGTW